MGNVKITIYKNIHQITITIMRRTILSIMLVCCCLIPANAKNEKIDTLSYITGVQVGYNIDNQIMPQLRLDYDLIVSVLEKNFAKEKAVKVNGVTITPDNINEVAKKYFTQELNQRIQAAANDTAAEIFNPEEKEIVSTLIGADFAFRIKESPYPIEKKSFLMGLRETHAGKERITPAEGERFLTHYFTVVLPGKNKKESEEWLAKIAKGKGVKKTESGLLYKIENAGDMSVKANKDEDIVKVLYTGTTKDGKVFDSNRWADMPEERKEMTKKYQPGDAEKDSPIEFPLNGVIKGWTEGMKLIGKGGKITLWIPSGLAYGEKGAGQDIGPNEALRFDVELIDVTNK